MPEPELFTKDPEGDLRALRELGDVDIVVGIPSFNEADNIAHVVSECDGGLRRHFSGRKAAIINVDNDSMDDTESAFLGAESSTPLLYLSTPPRVRGKGNNFFNLFNAARILDADAVVAVDADLESITPEWIARLAGPLLDGEVDYLAPVYARNEYDGTITNHICYPLIHGLMGADLRQPIGGDFGMSASFIESLMQSDWADSTRQYGIDIFMTLNAVTNGHVLGQTILGAKVHKPSAPKLGPMFTQVVTTLFTTLSKRRDLWLNEDRNIPVTLFDDAATGEPQSLAVDYKAIKHQTIRDYQNMRPTIERLLTPQTFGVVEDRMNRRNRPRINIRTWMQIVYDLLYAFDQSGNDPEVIEAMKPLFFARVAAFFRYTIDIGHEEAEERIREQAKLFADNRSYLTDKYAMS